MNYLKWEIEIRTKIHIGLFFLLKEVTFFTEILLYRF